MRFEYLIVQWLQHIACQNDAIIEMLKPDKDQSVIDALAAKITANNTALAAAVSAAAVQPNTAQGA